MLIRFYFFNCFVKETFKLNFKHAIELNCMLDGIQNGQGGWFTI